MEERVGVSLEAARHGRHGRAVAAHAVQIAAELGFDPHDLIAIRLAGALHDVGKLALPRAILDKPAPLDAAEWEQVRRHPAIGAEILRAAGLVEIASWVRSHHERVDGLGYPDALRGEEIPVEARVLAVADAYDAMVSERPHSAPLDPDEACDELRRGAGTQFDAAVVDAFLATGPARLALAAAGR